MTVSNGENHHHHLIHCALILANSIFGLGSIVGALGISENTNPLSFTFCREICSGTILCGLSYLFGRHNGNNATTTRVLPQWSHVSSFFRLGFLLFLNQAGYIVGILLAGPVTGSIWQPSAPIITAAISMLSGLEPLNVQRVMGVLVAFAGCAAMVILSDRHDDEDDATGGIMAFWLGNALFLLNCTATAFFILCSKPLLVEYQYPALTVTAWSYLLASVFMLVASLISASIPSVDSLICPACDNNNDNRSSVLAIPHATLPALTYYILLQSVAAWGLILWANQYATGTLVVGYSVTQPMSAMLFTSLFLVTHWIASCSSNHSEEDGPCLNEPGLGTLCGMVGVACGLALVVQTEPTTKEEAVPKDAVKMEGTTTTTKYGSLATTTTLGPKKAGMKSHGGADGEVASLLAPRGSVDKSRDLESFVTNE